MYNWGLLVSTLNRWFRSGKHHWDFSHDAHATDGKTEAQGWAVMFPKAHSNYSSLSIWKNARFHSSRAQGTSSWEVMIVFKHWKKHLLEICCLFITMLVIRGDPKQKDMVFVHEKIFSKLGRQGSNIFTAAPRGQVQIQVNREDLKDRTAQTKYMLLEQFWVKGVTGWSD